MSLSHRLTLRHPVPSMHLHSRAVASAVSCNAAACPAVITPAAFSVAPGKGISYPTSPPSDSLTPRTSKNTRFVPGNTRIGLVRAITFFNIIRHFSRRSKSAGTLAVFFLHASSIDTVFCKSGNEPRTVSRYSETSVEKFLKSLAVVDKVPDTSPSNELRKSRISPTISPVMLSLSAVYFMNSMSSEICNLRLSSIMRLVKAIVKLGREQAWSHRFVS